MAQNTIVVPQHPRSVVGWSVVGMAVVATIAVVCVYIVPPSTWSVARNSAVAAILDAPTPPTAVVSPTGRYESATRYGDGFAVVRDKSLLGMFHTTKVNGNVVWEGPGDKLVVYREEVRSGVRLRLRFTTLSPFTDLREDTTGEQINGYRLIGSYRTECCPAEFHEVGEIVSGAKVHLLVRAPAPICLSLGRGATTVILPNTIVPWDRPGRLMLSVPMKPPYNTGTPQGIEITFYTKV